MSARHHTKDKFTQEDDEHLKEIVGKLEEIDWKTVAHQMGNKNARQCKDRWVNYLSPTVNRSKFSFQEDILLLEKYNIYGPKWVFISKFFENRTDVNIKARFLILKRRGYSVEYLKRLLDRRMNPKSQSKRNKIAQQPLSKEPSSPTPDWDFFNQITIETFEKENNDMLSLLGGQEAHFFNFC
ncbi:Myb-like DNA-binding domain containing protein [Trichomonas vaginalis G3]|uniref:Myb-like DNA-binding domain containing protein n=1 Tax=Trichomonas vaginalis (strain ATCC PRA-98 / G3) TaxID=412133 RepID=A2GIF2_TRIV3|nr:RNA polymerase II transcription regulator recruiting protein [Trichomonas vaginalis G3]EAX83065.1 Myb-like DNA-binding domain containing protein [Trichomonas vaginalis G3]KAI5508000.1 RNA polymerase II transcription regulator recruiting protein [Trichomonas vaginalis G3]|eukprot:XP_001295995.1 Myb-like DNA-binding domain containing protein [Trichomonas vaginalis G3]